MGFGSPVRDATRSPRRRTRYPSAREQQARRGRGAYKYAGMYKGSTRDAAEGVPEPTRAARAERATQRAVHLASRVERRAIKALSLPKGLTRGLTSKQQRD